MTEVMQEIDPLDHTQCLEYLRDGGCAGDVEYRDALSPTGTMYPRCDRHWERRLDEQQKINENYPDSPHPPSWFDPLAAGESWDDD